MTKKLILIVRKKEGIYLPLLLLYEKSKKGGDLKLK
jgi:hypothetical protein